MTTRNALLRLTLLTVLTAWICGCASVMSSATSGLADNLGRAILNQDDPETVRDGAPAFLLMLDSFVEGSPDDPAMLSAAAELYAAYGVMFVADSERAARLTQRARDYAARGLCISNSRSCNLENLPYPEYAAVLEDLKPGDVPALFTYSQAWLAMIRASSGDLSALSKLPHAEAALRRVRGLDPHYREGEVSHYLGILSTVRPPALGGQFEEGREHFERAMALTEGQDLPVLVDFARFYARTLYDRELHDQLLTQVLEADPRIPEKTLLNVLAQREARELMAAAEDYF